MVQVLSIIGYTRSGSTLLDSILGELDGVFSAGELYFLWERGLLEGRTCGCGKRVADCEVWSAVLERSFGDRVPDPRQVMDWQSRAARTRHTPALLAGGRGPIDGPSLRAYSRTLSSIYRSIAEVTGCDVIVDSSKHPSDGALTMLLEGVEASIVHLVRDPRAVVFSWRRTKRELDHPDAVDMPQRSVITTAGGWVGMNLAAETVRRRAGRSGSLLRYEDLAAHPHAEIVQIAQMIGAPTDRLPFGSDDTVTLGENHTVSGNPGRFRRGTVPVRPDTEWRSQMRTSDRLLTDVVTLPLRWRYGYSSRASKGR